MRSSEHSLRAGFRVVVAGVFLAAFSPFVAAAPPVAGADVFSPLPTAVNTLAIPLGNGTDGEVIAFNPEDQMIYHTSGNSTLVFERFPSTAPFTPVTNIPVSGTPGGETFGLVWYPPVGKFLRTNILSQLFTMTTDGVCGPVIGTTFDREQPPVEIDVRGLALAGTRVFGANPFANKLIEIDPANAATLSLRAVTLDGGAVTPTGFNALTTDPVTGSIYGIAKVTGVTGRVLVQVDVRNATAKSIGNTGRNFSSLTMLADGKLYGVTGKGDATPKTLFKFTRAAEIATEDSLQQTFSGLLGNDNDPDVGDTLDTAPAGPAASALGATFSILAGGSFTYDPSASAGLQALGQDELGVDTFSYTVKDQNGETATGTVTVHVAGVNDAPLVDLDGPGGSVDFQGPPVVLNPPAAAKIADADATITDDTTDRVFSLTATLGGVLDAGMEILAATASGGADTVAFVGNVLTVTASAGSAPRADFQAVLRSITYRDDSATPTAGTRTVAVRVSDGLVLSAVATRTIFTFVRPPAPVITASANAGPIVKTLPTGAPAPGAGTGGLAADATLGAFFTPAISDYRDFAARATLIAAKKKLGAIYVEDPTGAGVLAAFEGKPADGLAVGVTFKTFRDPLLDPNGNVTFAATVKGGGLKTTHDEGVWTEVFGALAPVLREGEQVPGLPMGVTLKSVLSLSPRIGELLALVKLNAKPGLVTAKNDVALLLLTGPAAATKLLRTGEPTNGPIALAIAAFLPAQFSKGQGRTHADAGVVVRVKTDTAGDQLVLIDDAGAKTVLLKTSAADPTLGAQATKILIPSTAGTGTASRITAKFPPATKTFDSIIFTSTNQPFDHITSAGDPIPAGGASFVSFNDPVVNDAPSAVFLAKFAAAGLKAPGDTALFSWDAGYAQSEIVRGGAAANGPAATPLANTAFKKFTNYALPDGTGAGVIFTAEVSGTAVSAKNKPGLWAEDSAHQIRQLLRADQDVTVSPGVIKKVLSFRLLDALPGSFGSRRSYNATGSVAVLATFTDKTQALLRIDIP